MTDDIRRVRFRAIPDLADKPVIALLDAEYPGSLNWLTVADLIDAIEASAKENAEFRKSIKKAEEKCTKTSKG